MKSAILIFAFAAVAFASPAPLSGLQQPVDAEQVAFSSPDAVGLTPLDLVTMTRIGSAVVSPTGKWALVSSSKYSQEDNKTDRYLNLLDIESGESHVVGSGAEAVWVGDHQFVHVNSYDNSLLYTTVSDKSSTYGFTIISKGDVKYDIANLKYNSATNKLSFTSEVYFGLSLAETLAKDEALKAEPSSAKVFDKTYFRHWDKFDNHKVSHIFSIDLTTTTSSLDLDTARDLMAQSSGMSCPIAPFGDGSQFIFSEAGDELLFASMAHFDKSEQAWSTESQIYRRTLSSEDIECVSCDQGVGAKTGPAYSPDGKYISWLQMKTPQYEADKNNLIVMEVATGIKSVVTADWDRSVDSYSWSLDGKWIAVIAQEYGRVKVAKIKLEDKSLIYMYGRGSTSSVQVIPGQNDRYLIANSKMTRSTEFFVIGGGHEPKMVSSYNTEAFAKMKLVEPEEFWFTGAMEERVMGWVMKPVGYEEGKTYPVAYLIHGGPQSSWEDSWSTRWNGEIFTSAGYAVVIVNFHGSTGYGQAFTDSINKNWGTYPYDDVMKGLDYALEHNSYMDKSNIIGLGASYGGFMINWLNGHTDRFKALINHDGLFDLKSMYYTTEEIYFQEHDLGGTPYDKPEFYDKFNPSEFVKNWKTPTLVVQGGIDYRVPVGQGFSTFTALQRLGIESKLVFFPDENHWVLKPANSLKWHHEVLDWMAKWVKA